VHLATEHESREVHIDAVDFVEGGAAARHLPGLGAPFGHRVRVTPVLLDFDVGRNPRCRSLRPHSTRCSPRSSISYVADPKLLLERIRLALKPRGRLVLSTLKRDADISRLHVEGSRAARWTRRCRVWSGRRRVHRRDGRSFLNDASRNPRSGGGRTFRFWTWTSSAPWCAAPPARREIVPCARDPPQAVVIVARRD